MSFSDQLDQARLNRKISELKKLVALAGPLVFGAFYHFGTMYGIAGILFFFLVAYVFADLPGPVDRKDKKDKRGKKDKKDKKERANKKAQGGDRRARQSSKYATASSLEALQNLLEIVQIPAQFNATKDFEELQEELDADENSDIAPELACLALSQQITGRGTAVLNDAEACINYMLSEEASTELDFFTHWLEQACAATFSDNQKRNVMAALLADELLQALNALLDNYVLHRQKARRTKRRRRHPKSRSKGASGAESADDGENANAEEQDPFPLIVLQNGTLRVVLTACKGWFAGLSTGSGVGGKKGKQGKHGKQTLGGGVLRSLLAEGVSTMQLIALALSYSDVASAERAVADRDTDMLHIVLDALRLGQDKSGSKSADGGDVNNGFGGDKQCTTVSWGFLRTRAGDALESLLLKPDPHKRRLSKFKSGAGNEDEEEAGELMQKLTDLAMDASEMQVISTGQDVDDADDDASWAVVVAKLQIELENPNLAAYSDDGSYDEGHGFGDSGYGDGDEDMPMEVI
jgi:hypothetical protein